MSAGDNHRPTLYQQRRRSGADRAQRAV